MMTGDFLRWILIANVLAMPVAVFAMSRWLQNFAFRAPDRPGIPSAAAALTLDLAMLAVGAQALLAPGPTRSTACTTNKAELHPLR